MENDINQLLKLGATIQVVPVAAILPEFEKLHEKIRELTAEVEQLKKALETKGSLPERLTTPEVVKEFRISQTTLWRLAKKKILSPVGRNGQNKIYLRKDVEDYQSSTLRRFED